jgi:hypothetical protein
MPAAVAGAEAPSQQQQPEQPQLKSGEAASVSAPAVAPVPVATSEVSAPATTSLVAMNEDISPRPTKRMRPTSPSIDEPAASALTGGSSSVETAISEQTEPMMATSSFEEHTATAVPESAASIDSLSVELVAEAGVATGMRVDSSAGTTDSNAAVAPPVTAEATDVFTAAPISAIAVPAHPAHPTDDASANSAALAVDQTTSTAVTGAPVPAVPSAGIDPAATTAATGAAADPLASLDLQPINDADFL